MFSNVASLPSLDEEFQLLLSEFSSSGDDDCCFVDEPVLLVPPPKKEKQSRYHQFAPIPKVLKRDMRRSYPEMIANVFNSNEIGIAEEFFSTFSSQNLTFIQRHVAFPYEPRIHTQGLSKFLQFWFNRVQLNSDFVFHFDEVTVHTFANTDASKVICRFNTRSTRIIDLPFDALVPSKDVKPLLNDSIAGVQKGIVTPKQRRKRPVSGTAPSCIQYDTSIVDAISRAPLLESPVESGVDGVMTLYLNANKEVIQLIFDAHNLLQIN